MSVWWEGALLGYDTETTGVNVKSDRIVTVALIRRENGIDTETTWLADPGVEIPAMASDIHGITTKQAQEQGRPIVDVIEEVASELTQAMSSGIPVVAFNASYDIQILNNELKRHGLALLEDRLGGDVLPIIDPLVIDRAVDRYRKGPRKLQNLSVHYQIPERENMHTAEIDVAVTLDVLVAIIKAYPELRELNLEQLHQWQISAHKEWASNFNQWLARKGRPATVEESWPVP